MNTDNRLADWTVREYDSETDRVRSTSLKWMIGDHGPREYYLRTNGLLETERSTGDHFDLGTLFHDLCLTGRVGWFVYPDRRGTKRHAEAVQENNGLIDIKPDDQALLYSMYDSVMANKEARSLIENAASEQTMLWTDDVTGLRCKARADILCHNGIIADIKTWAHKSGKCTPERFFWHTEDLGYHHSAAFYEMGREACLGVRDRPFIHIAVWKKRPHWCYCWPLSKYALEVAHRDMRKALDLLVECQAAESEIALNGGDPMDAWPDVLEETQSEGYVPSDSWLARHDYGWR